ncbi:MAG: hypothetical protein JNK12_11260 [Acidimicrobiales bacterium]|nr:hypothetical protein [Acidimicrobiales bacterium]
MAEPQDLLRRGAAVGGEPDLAVVERRVRGRRRRKRSVVAGAVALVLVALGASVAVRQGDPESQRVVTGPDGRSLSEPVGSWHQAADPPFAAREGAFTATTDDGRILVWGGGGQGGASDVQVDGGIYDPESDEWEAIPEAPLGTSTRHATASLVANRLAVADGEGSPATAAVFDLEEMTWTEAPPTGVDGILSGPLWDGTTMALLRILPGGGGSEPQTLRWHVGEDAWTNGAPYPLGARDVPAIARHEGRFAVWGGTTSDDLGPGRPVAPGPDPGATSDGAVYDLASDTWQEMPPGPLEPRVHADAIWQEGNVVVGAGSNDFDESETPLSPIIARYDPSTNSWGELPFPPADVVNANWNGVEAPAFFLEGGASGAITVEGEAGMHSGPQPRWFTLGGEWEEAPFYDLHDLDVGLVATSATRDNPDDGPFQLAVRVAPGVWLDGTDGPFTNRREPAVGTAGDHLLVVGGLEGRDIEPVGDAWVFDVSG